MNGIYLRLHRLSPFHYQKAFGTGRKQTFVAVLALLIGVVTLCRAHGAEQSVYLYVYHNKPPFIVDIDRKNGLYFDFARLLNQRSDKYEFITVYVPRKRLDRMIESNVLDGVVLGANPVWFKDLAETRFLWLPAIFDDADEFVSLRTTPFEYIDQTSFNGKTLAGVAGYFYYATVNAVEEGRLERVDTIGEQEVLSLIALGRADMGIVSQSVFKYLQKHGDLDDVFHFSARRHEVFERRAFMSRERPELYKEIRPLIRGVLNDGSWQKLVERYQ